MRIRSRARCSYPRPMSLTAVARSEHGALRASVDVNGRHVIVTDEPTRLGGTDAGPAPHELLPAALASCVGTMISLYAQTKGWALSGVEVAVEYDPDAVPRHCWIEVHLPESLSADQVKRLERVANTCPLRRALETGFEFDEQIVLDRPAAPRKAA
jgi:putative redox protein